MIKRLAPLLLLVLVVWPAGSSAGAAGETLSVEIKIVGLPQPLQLAPADVDAFRRRLGPPPVLTVPAATGEAFEVTSDYWDETLGSGVNAPLIQPEASYFPAFGVVLVDRPNGEKVYVVLDQRQRALLNRYIRLGRTGAVAPHPGALQVLAAASHSEPVSIVIGSKPVDEPLARLIWAAIDGKPGFRFLDPPRPPGAATGTWLTFTTAEGRAIQYLYDPESQTLTDALGTEVYSIVPLPLDPATPLQLEQQPAQGSKLWWPLMLGGGIALLAAAVWLQRRYA